MEGAWQVQPKTALHPKLPGTRAQFPLGGVA